MGETPIPPLMADLPLLYRDDRLAAFAKPSGLLVHRGWGDDDVVAVDLAHASIGARVFPVHRLDRATSGVLLFALDGEGAAAVGKMFAAGEVHKTYVALVRGVPPEEIIIDHPVPKAEQGPRVDAVTEVRRLCVTEPLGPDDRRYAIVEARPRTGRLHQIRRHLRHAGHPIVGDVNYGQGDINRFFRASFGLHRLALHAQALAFEHPFTGETLTIHAPLPTDLTEPAARMGITWPTWPVAPAPRHR
jgi:tRNA pseudouridine65 synthase